MSRYPWTAVLLLLAVGCAGTGSTVDSQHKATAERFLRALYGGDLAVVEELAAPDIAISYPVFHELFDTPAIRGLEAAKEFSSGFSSRWTDARITVHEAVAEDDRVVLVWSFSARAAGSSPSDEPQSWGGITLYRFDASGRIAVEVGEESDPGPWGRLSGAQ